MHRSGTSFVSSILQEAGLYLGDRLMAATPDNPHGYFENLDFVDFHRLVLASHALSPDGWVRTGPLTVPSDFLPFAEKLVSANSCLDRPWGFKDPRTAVFLDFWAKFLPSAKFLFVVRSPWEVIDSLFRRGDPVFLKNPILAIETWNNFNQIILNFTERFPDRSLLISLDQVIENSHGLITSINEQLGFSLNLPEKNYTNKVF